MDKNNRFHLFPKETAILLEKKLQGVYKEPDKFVSLLTVINGRKVRIVLEVDIEPLSLPNA